MHFKVFYKYNNVQNMGVYKMTIKNITLIGLSIIAMNGCDLNELKKFLSDGGIDPKVNLIEAIDKGRIGGFDREDSINVQYEIVINYVRSLNITCNDDEQKSGPSPEIDSNSKLVKAAKEHSLDMLQSDNFSHEGSDGSSSYDRMRKQGFKGSKYSGNIYYKRDSLGTGKNNWIDAIEAWIESKDGHCSNLMDPDITDFGMYEAKSSDETTSYVTLDLGAKQD